MPELRGESDDEHRLLLAALTAFDSRHPSSYAPLSARLDATARTLIADREARVRIGTTEPPVWPKLLCIWHHLAKRTEHPEEQAITPSAAATSAEVHGDSVDSNVPTDEDEPSIALTLSLAKFTRNLVADVLSNQSSAFPVEPHIRTLIRHYTSWTRASDASFYPTTRVLAQTLSNLVTSNPPLLSHVWTTYMALPSEQAILVRLLASPDAATVAATSVLVLNCTRGSPERALALATTSAGSSVCIALLDRLDGFLESSDGSPEGAAFDIGYAIFEGLFPQRGLVAQLYSNMAMPDEPIMPSQTTLLKLLDAHLQQSPVSAPPASSASELNIRPDTDTDSNILDFLALRFFSFSAYAQSAIQRALGTSEAAVGRDTDTDSSAEATASAASHLSGELDMRLPGVCAALVLVAQCLIALLLHAEARAEDPRQDGNVESTSPEASLPSPKSYLVGCQTPIEARAPDARQREERRRSGFVEILIEDLRLLDAFLPRITFADSNPSPVPSPVPTPAPSAQPPPRETSPLPADRYDTAADPTGFAYLKRDLVRLLAILCHNHRAVQDRVRACDGITVVMNLCVVDKRNPYLREHAIFALRNLLHENSENQAVVNAIRPMGTWDADGVLRDTPGAVRR